jgi:4a-hydroxytetrahydrobiopterin dehydratase
MELVDSQLLEQTLSSLDWHLENGELVKVVRRHDFAEALQYLNAVGAVAESVGHHPDIELRWNTVTLRLRTHSMNGITDADLDLAAKIDSLT